MAYLVLRRCEEQAVMLLQAHYSMGLFLE
jgi:hypothetical protein